MAPRQIVMNSYNQNSVKLLETSGIMDGNEHAEKYTKKCKCVLLGDGAVGKTSLIVSYTTNGYPTEYIPTAFDNYTVVVTVDNNPLQVQICDTAGQDDFDTLRPLCYPDSDVFLVCFSVLSPTSFLNVTDKWIPEIRRISRRVPIIVVGTQCDLRNDVKVLIDLASHKQKPVSESSARQLVNQCGAVEYIECSALTQQNLKQVFDAAIFSALQYAEQSSVPKKAIKSHSKQSYSSPSNDHKKSRKPAWKRMCCFVT